MENNFVFEGLKINLDKVLMYDHNNGLLTFENGVTVDLFKRIKDSVHDGGIVTTEDKGYIDFALREGKKYLFDNLLFWDKDKY